MFQYSEIWGKKALHRNRAMWSFSQDTAANLTDPLGCNKARNCSTLSVHQTSSDAIIGVVSGNQRQKPSRYLPDIWAKRGPRDICQIFGRREALEIFEQRRSEKALAKKGSFVARICISRRFSRGGNGSFQLRSVNTKALSGQFWQRGSFIPCSDQIALEVEKSQAPKVVSSIRSNWNLSSMPLSSLLICASDKKIPLKSGAIIIMHLGWINSFVIIMCDLWRKLSMVYALMNILHRHHYFKRTTKLVSAVFSVMLE